MNLEVKNPLNINCKAGEALQIALKHRDEYTQFHCERVANIAIKTGIHLGLSKEKLEILEIAAIFHDIGKIGMPDEILLNTGKLSESQFAQMKTHTAIGASIAEKLDIANPDRVAKIILHHHEAYDGSGYPDGLAGEQIPLCSRILCIIDVFDALTSDRRYRDAISIENTLNKMSADMSHKFDPKLFEIISNVIRTEISFE